MSLPRGSFRVRLAAIVAGAVALRLLYVLVLARHVPLAGDSQFFHAEANLVADRRGSPARGAPGWGRAAPTSSRPRTPPTGSTCPPPPTRRSTRRCWQPGPGS